MRRRTPLAALVLAAGLMLAGCASRDGGRPPTASPPTAPGSFRGEASETLLAAYAAAIESARYPAPEKISRDLTPLLPSTEELIWDQGRILMVTWTRAEHFADPETFRRGAPFALAVDTWLTAAPFARDACRGFGLDGELLTLRLEQLIGLPPGRGKDAFLEIWVDPADLFRPCPDPEIFDHECLVEVPLVGRDADRQPWDCSRKRQVSSRFVTVDPKHLEWMCYNWALSYGSDELLDNYPWTALGYTYDWGNPEDPRGLSEYVAPKGAPVIFQSLTPTRLYCSPPPPAN